MYKHNYAAVIMYKNYFDIFDVSFMVAKSYISRSSNMISIICFFEKMSMIQQTYIQYTGCPHKMSMQLFFALKLLLVP